MEKYKYKLIHPSYPAYIVYDENGRYVARIEEVKEGQWKGQNLGLYSFGNEPEEVVDKIVGLMDRLKNNNTASDCS